MKATDWDQLQPRFAKLRAEVGLDSLRMLIGCSRASVDKWARGACRPSIPVYVDRIRTVVTRYDLSQVRHTGERREGLGR